MSKQKGIKFSNFMFINFENLYKDNLSLANIVNYADFRWCNLVEPRWPRVARLVVYQLSLAYFDKFYS